MTYNVIVVGGSFAGFEEIGDGDGSQNANDRHDDHDFDESKRAPARGSDVHK